MFQLRLAGPGDREYRAFIWALFALLVVVFLMAYCTVHQPSELLDLLQRRGLNLGVSGVTRHKETCDTTELTKQLNTDCLRQLL